MPVDPSSVELSTPRVAIDLEPRSADVSSERLRSTACLNCGVALTGPFCSACGQRDVPPYPTVRELVVDAFWELSGWDGRFAVTVRTLLRRPGKLTREFLEGRRARYISPLRLYLMASIVFFVVAAATPDRDRQAGDSVSVGAGVNLNLGGADDSTVLRGIENAPRPLRAFVRRAVADREGLKRDVNETMPRVLFALLPLFALIVSIFYRGRRYPEHLYFAIHLHAFVFLALTVPELVSFTRSAMLADGVGFAAAVWIPIYATLAFRQVYRGSLARTVLKELGIATIYGVASLAAFIAMFYWVSIGE
jgi:hypothetical protein